MKNWAHDIENALNCIEFISGLIEDGYGFDDHRAGERKKHLKEAILVLRKEFGQRENLNPIKDHDVFDSSLKKTESLPPVAAILIDDDSLVRDSWEIAASYSNLIIRTFKSADEFFKYSDQFDVNTPIFIDHLLGDGLKGLGFSKRIFELGFKKIYIASGYPIEGLSHYPWVLGSVGKKFPFRPSTY